MLTNTIGFLASCIAFIMFIPSAVTIYKNRHDAHALRGSSIGMNLLLITNALLWGVYGFLSSAFWVAAPGLVNLPLAVFSIYAIVRSRQQESVKEPLWDDDHKIFITTPPGFGSVVRPNHSNIRHGILFKTDEELHQIRLQQGLPVNS